MGKQISYDKELRRTHRRGLDRMPKRYKLQLAPKFALLQLLQSGILGCIAGYLLYRCKGQYDAGKMTDAFFDLLMALLPLGFFIRYFRRLLETLTLRFDVFGGMVTEIRTETEKHWNPASESSRDRLRYYITFNDDRQKVSSFQSSTVKAGDYCLLARYRRHYVEDDVYLFSKTSPDAEENRLTSDFPKETVRLSCRTKMPTWSTLLPIFLIPLMALLLYLIKEADKSGMPLLGMQLTQWQKIIGIGGIALAVLLVVMGFVVRFSKEHRQLAQKKHLAKRKEQHHDGTDGTSPESA